MLLLLFYLNNELYAIDSSEVLEVIPKVILKKLHHAPDYVAGLLNYRGKILPVIDLALLIEGSPCRVCLSTRIIIVQYLGSSEAKGYLGLMAEQIIDTLSKPSSDKQGSNLPEIIIHQQQIIQLLQVESLLPLLRKTSTFISKGIGMGNRGMGNGEGDNNNY